MKGRMTVLLWRLDDDDVGEELRMSDACFCFVACFIFWTVVRFMFSLFASGNYLIGKKMS